MSMPSLPQVQTTAAAPSQSDADTAAAMEKSETERKQQIMNMQGRSSTIGTSAIGDTNPVQGYKVSLLGGN